MQQVQCTWVLYLVSSSHEATAGTWKTSASASVTPSSAVLLIIESEIRKSNPSNLLNPARDCSPRLCITNVCAVWERGIVFIPACLASCQTVETQRQRGNRGEQPSRKFCQVHNADHFTQLHEVSHNQWSEWRATGGEFPSLHLHVVCAACPGWLHVGSWDLFQQSFWERVSCLDRVPFRAFATINCVPLVSAFLRVVPFNTNSEDRWKKKTPGCLFIAHPPPHLHRGFLKSTAIRQCWQREAGSVALACVHLPQEPRTHRPQRTGTKK